MKCPECKEEMAEEYRLDIWNKIWVCPSCGIMKWGFSLVGKFVRCETWKRIERK